MCLLIDVRIPSPRNGTQKEVAEILKYKHLRVEIQRLWNMKFFVILVFIGATEFATKELLTPVVTCVGVCHVLGV
jgi:hypothetical protein